MGLIDKYKQDLVGKVFLYVMNGGDPSYAYCIAEIISLANGGARCKIFCTNIFSYEHQWFCKGCSMDQNSKIIADMNINYLKLFQEFRDPARIIGGITWN